MKECRRCKACNGTGVIADTLVAFAGAWWHPRCMSRAMYTAWKHSRRYD